jgi:Transcription factor TFIID (or TATA-binding protein, TBP)
MIRNINYKGHVSPDEMDKFNFTKVKPPYQVVIPIDNGGKLLLFPSGKCRLMGLKKPFSEEIQLPLKIYNVEIQSVTVTCHVGHQINLPKLARQMPPKERMYEPELFPALRMTKFNPICVNVFSTGKVVILGLKSLSYQSLLNSIVQDLRVYKAEGSE